MVIGIFMELLPGSNRPRHESKPKNASNGNSQNPKQPPGTFFPGLHLWLMLEDHWPRNIIVISRTCTCKSANTVNRAKSIRTMLSVLRRKLLGFKSLSRKHNQREVVNTYCSTDFEIHCLSCLHSISLLRWDRHVREVLRFVGWMLSVQCGLQVHDHLLQHVPDA